MYQQKCKGTNTNIVARYEEIWLNMFRTGRDKFLVKNAVFNLIKNERYQNFATQLGS